MNNFDNDTTQSPDASDFIGGAFLRKEDLDGPVTVTIADVRSQYFRGTGRTRLVVLFRGMKKPLILNKTNIHRLVEIFGTVKTASWRGMVTLYVDPTIEFGGRTVGGVRIKNAEVDQPIEYGNGWDRREADLI